MNMLTSNAEGLTPLMLAVQKASLESLRILLANTADVHKVSAEKSRSIVHYVITSCRHRTTRPYKKCNVPVNREVEMLGKYCI